MDFEMEAITPQFTAPICFESNFSLPFFFLFLFCFVVVFFLIFATSTGLHTSNTYFTSEIYYAETQAVTYYSFSLTSLNIFQ